MAHTCRPTPLIEATELAAAIGCRVVLKCENLNPTGAFKVRGGVNLLAALSPSENGCGEWRRRRPGITDNQSHTPRASSPARRRSLCPKRANPLKVAATEALGAEVIQTGCDFDAARLAAEQHALRTGMRYVHSSNEPLLVAGVGTAALEMFEAAPDLDVIFVPVGAGSGVLGAGVVARAVNPAVRVVGVQSEGAPAVYRSWREGRRVVTPNVTTFAEGLATREPFEMPLALFPSLVDEIMLVSDEQIAEAVYLLLKTTRQVAEGAGTATVAAAMARRRSARRQECRLDLKRWEYHGRAIVADLKQSVSFLTFRPVVKSAAVGIQGTLFSFRSK